jgi:hypothetical protein
MTARLAPRTWLLLAVLVVSTLVGLVAAKLNSARTVPVATATTHAFVDLSGPSIIQKTALADEVANLQRRAELYARLMTTPPVLARIAERTGIPAARIGALARTTAPVPFALTQESSEERAHEIRQSQQPYHIEVQSDPGEPLIAVYTQAPSIVEAERLATSSLAGLRDYLDALARREGVPSRVEASVHQLGKASGRVQGGKAAVVIGGLTFLAAFCITFVVLAGVAYGWRRRGRAVRMEHSGPHLAPAAPAPAGPTPGRTSAPPRAAALGDWPRTTRVLPWLLAAFIAMLWLVPFNTIELAVSTPIDLKLDRLVLPFVVLAWGLAFLGGGAFAPRLKLTWIHAAIGAFVACVLVGVVLGAQQLHQLQELDLAVKKLPLLIAYVSVFVMVASAVRPSEVRPFMNYTLVLAVICGLGIIWQYRMHQNLFTIVSDKLLPGAFTIASDTSGGDLDSLGRRWIAGPAEAGLEAVTMLSMALSIAVVGLVGDRGRKERLLYVLAACILLAAIFATGRKSALLAPAAVVLTLAYFRRRELLSLAPAGLIIAIVVSVLSPGAVQGTISQFIRPDRASVPTTSDRTADYDAIRPDLWTNFLLGRGYGSYNHETYRVLDSDVLSRVVETGVLGLLTFFAIGISVVLTARRTIAARDPTYSPVALIGAAAAVCFLVASALFDVLGFPHAPYIFLYLTGLVAVVVARDPEPDPVPTAPERAHGGRRHRRAVQVPLVVRR